MYYTFHIAGVADPCDNNKWLHNSLSYEQQDLLCLTAQNLIRILAHGGPAPLLNGKSSKLTFGPHYFLSSFFNQ